MATARRTKELLDGDGGLRDILDRVEKSYAEALFDTEVTDTSTREALYHRTLALRDIRAMALSLINRGAGAETIVKRLSKVRAA